MPITFLFLILVKEAITGPRSLGVAAFHWILKWAAVWPEGCDDKTICPFAFFLDSSCVILLILIVL